MTWSPEMKARALALDKEGISASNIMKDPLIAAGGKTRNAVIGFLHRYKQKNIRRTPRQMKQDVAQKLKSTRRRKPSSKPKPKAPPKRSLVARNGPVLSRRDLPPPPPSRDLSLVDLTPAHCRYPTAGEGADVKFCGHPRDQRQTRPLDVYCTIHAAHCRRV